MTFRLCKILYEGTTSAVLTESAFWPLPPIFPPNAPVLPDIRADRGRLFASDESEAPPVSEIGTDVNIESPYEQLKGRVVAVDGNILTMEVRKTRGTGVMSKSRLRNESECITLGASGDRVVYGNSRGYGLLQKLDEMDRAMESLTAQNERETSQIEVTVQESSRAPDSKLGRLSIDSEAVLSSI